MEFIHIDIRGPLPPGVHGERYWITIVDDLTGYVECDPLKNRSEAPFAIKRFLRKNERPERKTHRARLDQAGEFTSNELVNFLKDMGIAVEFTGTDQHQANGIAEITNRIMHERLMATLLSGKIPLKYWPYVVRTVAYLRLFTPHIRLDMTPYQAWFGDKPDISHLRPIGSRGWMYKTGYRNKLVDNKGVPCRLLGYEGTSVYRVLRDDGHVILTQDFVCQEERLCPRRFWGLDNHLEETSTGSKRALEVDRVDPKRPRAASRGENSAEQTAEAAETIENPLDWPLQENALPIPNPNPEGSQKGYEGASIAQEGFSIEESNGGGRDGPGNESEDDTGSSNRAGPHTPDLSDTIVNSPSVSEAEAYTSALSNIVNSGRGGGAGAYTPESTTTIASDEEQDRSRAGRESESVEEDGTASRPKIRISPRSNKGLYPQGSTQRYGMLFALVGVAMMAAEACEPKSLAEAKASIHWNRWLEAMKQELQSIETNKTWTLVPRPGNRHVLRGKWVYKLKRGPNGEILRYKAHWVVRGFEQKYGIDYNETFASVVKPMSYKALFAIAAALDLEIHQMDVKTAFLYGSVKEEIYVEQPPGLGNDPGKVCRLNKALYGLKQSPRIWYNTLAGFLGELGFKPLISDLGIFVKGSVYIAIYVDDLLIAGPDLEELKGLKAALSKRFEMTDLGECRYYLGMEIIRDRRNRTIRLSQRGYISKILDDFGFGEMKPVSTPMDTSKIEPAPKDYVAAEKDRN
jgi:hypothetical protein